MNPDPTSLDRLHDILLPPPTPWWPPPVGWYWVLGLIAVLLLAAAVQGFTHWQRNRYRREALAELRRIARHAAPGADRAEAVATMAGLLKRAALSVWHRAEVASLSGTPWLQFLDKTSTSTAFTSGHGAILEQATWDPSSVVTLDDAGFQELTLIVRHWLQHHHVPAGAIQPGGPPPC